MDNYNESLGLRVSCISPGQRESNVNINAPVTITFSADVNPSSFAENMVVLEDFNRIFRNVNSLKDYSKYRVVKGTVSYKDRVLTYTPHEPFHTDTCYVVMLNSGIKDITGNRMPKKHISCFFTESVASFPEVEIISPRYGTITDRMPEFAWKNQFSGAYEFQISRENSFELLLYNEVIPGNTIEECIKHRPSINVEEGMYHIRVRSQDGEWSNVHQVFIKAVTDAVVAEQDMPESMHLEEFLDGLEDPLEILEYFPPDGSVNTSLKTNIIYIKIRGKTEPEQLNLDECYVYGESFDEEHEEYAHEVVNGKWTVVYDAYFDVTYVIFTPEIIDGTNDTEYIETLRSGNLIETQAGGVNVEDS